MVRGRQFAPSLPFALLMLVSAVAANADTWKDVIPEARPRTALVSGDGVTVTIAMPDEYDLREETPTSAGMVTVKIARMRPFRLPNGTPREAHYGVSVGIGKLRRNDLQPTVFIRGYTGGAHCCHTLQIVSFVQGQVVVDKLPVADTPGLDAFPTDIDGDGTADIRWVDDSLLYAFTSYASSWHVPRFYNLRDGHPVNVSRRPGFAKIYRNFAAQTLVGCRNQVHGRNGSCAAYAYAMAVLGKPEDGIRTATSLAEPSDWLPGDCSTEYVENDECPDGKAITFASFEPALRYVMRKNGYLP
jgi:hypothetical protein